MSSTNINAQAAAAREGARTGSGQFGHQQHGVASNAHDTLPTPVDWNDVSAVGAHLSAAGLHGEIVSVTAGDYGHDDNIGDNHMVYTSAGGRRVGFGANDVGTIMSSNVGADADEGYFNSEFAEEKLPGAVVQETIDDIVEADCVSGGFNQAFSTSEKFGLVDSSLRLVDGKPMGEMTISEFDEGDFFRVSYDGSTGETRISVEHGDNEVSPELAADILEDIQPITYEENEPRQLSVGEVFTNALDRVKTDPDFSPSLARRMGIS